MKIKNSAEFKELEKNHKILILKYESLKDNIIFFGLFIKMDYILLFLTKNSNIDF